jgi:hypothetical protein
MISQFILDYFSAGYNRTDYFNRMSINTTWGGMIEICAVAELYEVNISIFKRNDDLERRYAWIGTFKYSLNHVLTKENNSYVNNCYMIFI